MCRSFLMFVAGLCLTGSAAGQTQPIQWLGNVSQGVSQAQRVGLPIMFYVSGASKSEGDNDMKDAQQVAFRDPLVGGIARERFVPIRLPRSTETKQLLEQLGAPTEHGNYVLFVTPEMKVISTAGAGQVADAKVLAGQMTAAFRQFRKELFERELKPKLESADTPVTDVISIFRKIEKLLIMEADESVVQLIKEGRLKPNVLKQAYGVLARLSTPKCAEALLEAAPGDKLAEQALGRCEPGVADVLIAALESESFDKSVIAYEALVKICKIGGKKSRAFWGGQNERLMKEELDRVERAARAAAQRWKDEYEAYR
jgi:hypothetical protein